MKHVFFKRLSLFATVLALCVIVLGAYVRLSDAGLGCPDWPGCYGALTVPQSEVAIQKAQVVFPGSPIESSKAWKEMAHRYLAGTLGLVILVMFLSSWRLKPSIKVHPLLPTALLVIVGFQAILGMWTVTLLLKPAIVSAHLIGGMTTLALLTWITHRHWVMDVTNSTISPALKLFIRGALLILLGQVFLGGWTSTNYAALACTDFPTCHGAWVPAMDFKDAFHLVRELGQSANGGNLTLPALVAIQWTHRIGALITFIYLAALAFKIINTQHLRTIALLLFAILLIQVCIGIANLVLQLPLALAVLHNLGAALLVMITVVLNSKITSTKYDHAKIHQ
ncbi:MAG: cytochrome C oxidase subunit I [Methylotenera sp. RIFCSPLOWO2_02_FULL_45_14]|nr:MAG: cytochrome C oxidase subunit I [Methylotenera sp. RIFCSPLOWO2_02_FULL_45_14]